jgi:hypothetical protein
VFHNGGVEERRSEARARTARSHLVVFKGTASVCLSVALAACVGSHKSLSGCMFEEPPIENCYGDMNIGAQHFVEAIQAPACSKLKIKLELKDRETDRSLVVDDKTYTNPYNMPMMVNVGNNLIDMADRLWAEQHGGSSKRPHEAYTWSVSMSGCLKYANGIHELPCAGSGGFCQEIRPDNPF